MDAYHPFPWRLMVHGLLAHEHHTYLWYSHDQCMAHTCAQVLVVWAHAFSIAKYRVIEKCLIVSIVLYFLLPVVQDYLNLMVLHGFYWIYHFHPVVGGLFVCDQYYPLVVLV